MATPTIAIIGTCDTKLQELLYIRDQIRTIHKLKTLLIDVGWNHTENNDIDISQRDIVNDPANGADGDNVFDRPRGEYIERMGRYTSKHLQRLVQDGKIQGAISAGGSGGTALSSAVMQEAFIVGFPKLIVSTIASGDTKDIVGARDITLMYSVVDVAGLNGVLRQVLSNAAAAISGMAVAYTHRQNSPSESASSKTRVGITMFGVTTPGVDAIRKHLESNYPVETYVFHATGTGGKAMEQLVFEKELDGLIDFTTTEITDLVMGGVMSAGDGRLDAASSGIPSIISLGATDMANFGARNTVPDKYKSYKIHEHNPLVTLVRSSAKETKEISEFFVKKLSNATKPENIELWIPKGGVSIISTPGGPFEDSEADKTLFDGIKTGLSSSGIKIIEDERDVNNKTFAIDVAEALVSKLKLQKSN